MSVLDLDDVDAIRRPTPALDRAWVIVFSLIALGGFASGFMQQVIGPLRPEPPVEAPPPMPAAAIQPPAQAPAPVVKPAMQVVAAEPAPAEPPKLDIPGPPSPSAESAAPALATTEQSAPAIAPADEPVTPTPDNPPEDVEEPPAG